MNEKILNKNRNGMLVLLLVILGYVAGIAGEIGRAHRLNSSHPSRSRMPSSA